MALYLPEPSVDAFCQRYYCTGLSVNQVNDAVREGRTSEDNMTSSHLPHDVNVRAAHNSTGLIQMQ